MLKFPRYRHSPIGTAWKIVKTRCGLQPVPLIVNLLLTHRCNLRCDYCAVWREPPPEMRTGTVLRLIDQIAAAGTERISLSGGEPMVRADIGQIIRHAKQRGLTVNLVSNGLHVPRRIKEIAGIDFLAISLDGSEAVHDRLRGEGAFARALAAIRAAHRAGIAVWTTTVLTRHNVGAVADIIGICRHEGARCTFLPVMRESLAARNAEALAPTREQLVDTMELLIAERRRPGSPLASSSELFAFYRDRWGSEPVARKGAWHGGTLRCHAGRLFCSVAPDGGLHPCSYRQRLAPGPNAATLGFAAAFEKLEAPQCDGCWCDSFIEANMIFGLRPGPVFNAVRVLAE